MTSLSKTVTKKRGRPVGSKNKTKPAAKVKTFKQSNSAIVQRLMKDNLQLIQDNKQLLFKIQLLEHKIIGFRAVVSYLEVQAGFKVTQ